MKEKFMIKLTRKHNIYEVWCEHAAESVFIDHKPTKKELEEIRIKNWTGTDQYNNPHKLKAFKLQPFYTSVLETEPKCLVCDGNGRDFSEWPLKRNEKELKCLVCDGTGMREFGNEKCPWCKGTGIQEDLGGDEPRLIE
jgi:hypothetical protein